MVRLSFVVNLLFTFAFTSSLAKDEVSQESLAAAGYLLAQRTDLKLNLSDPVDRKLSEILDRNGPDIRAAFDNREFVDVELPESKRAWQLLHEHAEKAINNRISLGQPAIEQLLVEAGASDRCLRSSREVLDGARRMEAWALRLINSWGNFPPVGIFEGTYTELGSFHVCTNLAHNKHIGHAHYCTVFMRPVLPSKLDYELVFTKKPKELLEMFQEPHREKDALGDLLEHAHYHHYVYYKWATCWPIGCSPFDVRRVVKRLAKANMLLMGPIKCYSAQEDDYMEPDAADNKTKLIHAFDNLNDGLYIVKPYFSFGQKVAICIIVFLVASMIIGTLMDLVYIRGSSIFIYLKQAWSNSSEPPDEGKREETVRKPTESLLLSLVDDVSIISNCSRFATISQAQLKNDILCLHGIRWITMCWIILTHTMMYNDWGQFGRTREIEKSLGSMATAPIFNGTYQVDTFFLLSGLLTAYSVFKQTRGDASKFSLTSYVLGRWLRLTPQLFLTIVVFIVLPLLSTGPHWYQATGQYSENCRKNWWINMLHLQVFYKTEQMCVFPSWWVSLDFFYHLLAVLVIYAILKGGHKLGFGAIFVLLASLVTQQAQKHFRLNLPANIYSTIPQTGKMWKEFTLDFYWQPYSHSVPFFLGFYLGYLMATRRDLLVGWFTPRRALIGWLLVFLALTFESYSTYWWLVGKVKPNQLEMTAVHVTLPIIWALSYCWTIAACHYGYGGWLNRFLSSKLFIYLSKTSYMVYLFHFHVIFLVYGSNNMLMEPTPTIMITLISVMIFLSTLYGILLSILIELPILRVAKKIMDLV